MIVLALFREMVKEGVAGLVEDENFFWEEAPLQRNGSPAKGVWLVTRSGSLQTSSKGLNLRTTVDFYVAMPNKVQTEQIHQQIREWLTEKLYFCQLKGEEGGVSYSFSNIRIRPTSTPNNVGATPNGTIVKVASAELVYDEEIVETPSTGIVYITTESGIGLLTENNQFLIKETSNG